MVNNNHDYTAKYFPNRTSEYLRNFLKKVQYYQVLNFLHFPLQSLIIFVTPVIWRYKPVWYNKNMDGEGEVEKGMSAEVLKSDEESRTRMLIMMGMENGWRKTMANPKLLPA